MPIISFTPADALKNAVVPSGAYRAMLTEVKAPKVSSSGKSENYWSVLEITDGKFKGKQIQCSFNTGTRNPSALGTTAFIPFDYFLRVDSAITGRTIEPEEYQLDTDELVNQEFDVRVEQSTDADGIIGNAIVDFFPVGTLTSAPEL